MVPAAMPAGQSGRNGRAGFDGNVISGDHFGIFACLSSF